MTPGAISGRYRHGGNNELKPSLSRDGGKNYRLGSAGW